MFHGFRSTRILLMVMATAFLSTMALAGEQFRVPLMAKPPTLDGKIDPQEWAVSAGFDGLFTGDQLQQRRAQAFVGADETHIYVALRTQLPSKGSISASVTEDNIKTVLDDSAEIYVDPVPDAPDQVMYQFIVNSIGHGGYQIHTVGRGQDNPGWRGDWKQAHSTHDGWWEWECAVPIASMKYVAQGRKTTDGAWKINICRNWKPDWGWSSLPMGGGYALAGCRFVFDKSAPAIQFSWNSDPFLQGAKGTLTLLNPTDQAMKLDASLFVNRNNMPEIKDQKALTIQPGQKEQIAVDLPTPDPTTHYELSASVKAADGSAVYYDRLTKWPKGEPVQYMGSGFEVKKPPVQVQFAYYPYLNKMRVSADITGMPKDAKLAKLTGVVREAESKKIIHTIDFPVNKFSNGCQELAFSLPQLRGNYEIVVNPEGRGVPTEAIVKPFERTVYEWENSKVGMSPKVYPPFTAIQVKGKKLSTVLREHTLNDIGLWDQMVATSAETGVAKPILAAPMRYVVKVNGKSTPIKAEALKVVSAKPNEAKTEARFTAGAMKASSVSTWDYDGTVRVDLTLEPSGGKSVDELTLEIPFTPDTARMIHANGDGIRCPIAQRIPDADGVAWDGSQISCTDYIPNFCPYVYIGSAVRGLTWFAENDRGWGWNPKTPNMELVRAGKQTILRIHLINQPTIIDKPRTITFGLLGAPVKPKLSPNGPNWWRYRYARDRYTLLGTDINWLALGDCGSVYPAGKDMFIWQMIAKGNKEHATDADTQQVINRGLKYFEPYGQDAVNTFKAHANYNMRSRYGMNMVFYYNRASYPAADEFETFKDEWNLSDLRNMEKSNSRGEIKIVPTKSYIDHALYWYAKSFEIGNNKGVYWDNMFISPTQNTVMTEAYKREDGKIVPASGIWGLRDLVKRTFVMMNERGMLPITFPHMTSFNCLPIMSFSTVQYDWEWKYSSGEVQDRFSREYIQLATDGELSGVWPTPLSDQGAQSNDPWIQRTFVATRIIHELDNGPVPQAIMDILDKPGMKAYRYWDDRPSPAVTNNPDLPTLVYSVPGREAVVTVVSYSTKDETTVLKIDKKALGFEGGFIAVDGETGEPVAVVGNTITFPLKKHDMRVLKIQAGFCIYGGRSSGEHLSAVRPGNPSLDAVFWNSVPEPIVRL